jgi:hypothetical protein
MLPLSGAGGATVRRWRGRIICTMLKCPPRKADALRACRCAGSLIAMTDKNNSGPMSRARIYELSVFQPTEVVRCWPFRVAPCSPRQGQTLTRLRAMLGGAWPTALAVSG